MIHATNAAVIAIPEEGIDKAEARDVKSKLDKRGGRSEATFEDILPTKEDGAFIKKAFINLIAELLVRYTPGSDKWENRKTMLEEIAKERPKDRPLPVHKTDTRPFGVFDVNEGSKKGIVELLGEMRERAGMSEDEWSHDVKVFVGDWLSSNNIRLARSDRRNDVDGYERMDYVEEESMLFHFALNYGQLLIRAHAGDGVQDPTSLLYHKGLLGRIWDINTANYAAVKSLVRHSLIARLHIKGQS